MTSNPLQLEKYSSLSFHYLLTGDMSFIYISLNQLPLPVHVRRIANNGGVNDLPGSTPHMMRYQQPDYFSEMISKGVKQPFI
jgi:hypothetical protein